MDASSIANDLAAQTLAAEMADVRASIGLVASGVASDITLTGLHFGRKIAELLADSAFDVGVDLEIDLWADDSVAADVRVRARSIEQTGRAHA
jgi:hypothetical protein